MHQFPKYVDLEFTARCNLKCGFCFGPVDHGRKELDLKPRFWVGVIDELHRRGCEGIVVSGGEPTLYPALAELLQHAKGLGLKIVVSTHGRHTGHVLKIARFCDWIALPVDAATEQVLTTMRGDTWGIDAAQRLATQIKDETGGVTQVKLGTVATAVNKDQVRMLAEAICAVDYDCFDTWKIYQYTPRRKFRAQREIYELSDADYEKLTKSIQSTALFHRLNIVFSSNQSRRDAYLFVYPDATVASPNNGTDFGDVVLGNLQHEGMSVLDGAQRLSFDRNAANYETTYV